MCVCNNAENSALHHRNTLHLIIYSNRKQLFYILINISQYHLYDCIHLFDQINAALVSIKY